MLRGAVTARRSARMTSGGRGEGGLTGGEKKNYRKGNQKKSGAIRSDASRTDHVSGVQGFTKGGQRRAPAGEGGGEGGSVEGEGEREGGGCSANLLSLGGGGRRGNGEKTESNGGMSVMQY